MNHAHSLAPIQRGSNFMLLTTAKERKKAEKEDGKRRSTWQKKSQYQNCLTENYINSIENINKCSLLGWLRILSPIMFKYMLCCSHDSTFFAHLLFANNTQTHISFEWTMELHAWSFEHWLFFIAFHIARVMVLYWAP